MESSENNNNVYWVEADVDYLKGRTCVGIIFSPFMMTQAEARESIKHLKYEHNINAEIKSGVASG